MRNIWIILSYSLVFLAILIISCNKDKKNENQTETKNCREYVKEHPGYEVWAGNTPLNDSITFTKLVDGYNVNSNYGYHFIDSATTTKSFNTGNYKYYIIVAKYRACVDAIQFFDSSYYNYGQGYTLIGGLAEYWAPYNQTNSRFLGAPDGVGGCLGYIDLCPPPVPANTVTLFPDGVCSSFNGFITDNKTITSRGGGLKVFIADSCECDSPM